MNIRQIQEPSKNRFVPRVKDSFKPKKYKG